MANLFQGIVNLIQGLIQSILAVFQGIFNLIYSIIYGAFSAVYNLIASFAQFLGASVGFVYSNIIVIGLLVLGYFIYQDRAARGRSLNTPATKKVA